VTLHADSEAGTNSPVLGVAIKRDSENDCDPRAKPWSVDHLKRVTAPEGYSVTWNSRDAGRVRHTEGPVRSPKSIDQSPPGV
jgi:hypothetical protein